MELHLRPRPPNPHSDSNAASCLSFLVGLASMPSSVPSTGRLVSILSTAHLAVPLLLPATQLTGGLASLSTLSSTSAYVCRPLHHMQRQFFPDNRTPDTPKPHFCWSFVLPPDIQKCRRWWAKVFPRLVAEIMGLRNIGKRSSSDVVALDLVPDLTENVRTSSLEVLGCGGCADIYKGAWRVTYSGRNGVSNEFTQTVVIKALRQFSSNGRLGHDSNIDIDEDLNREIKFMLRANHPNIARAFGMSFHMGGRPSIIMELYSNGNLRNYLSANPAADKGRLMFDLGCGVSHLHSLTPPIIHGDLKASNVLITESGTAVISDFGSSCTLGEIWSTHRTPRYQPPELHRHDGVATTASDVWSLACTAGEVWVDQLPYAKQRNPRAVTQIASGVKPFPRPAVTDRLQESIWNLFEACWELSPDARPSALEFTNAIGNIHANDHPVAENH